MSNINIFSELELNKNFYTIRDTECNSKIFGDCEICGKYVIQVHHKIIWKEIINPVKNKKSKIQISDCYGHLQCLK